MNDLQDKKYWRRWAAVSQANHWRMSKRRLDPAAVADASEAHAAVWAAACQLAAQRACGLTADLLRHGCHVVALGRDKGHAAMSNKEFDALLVYWGDERTLRGLLIEPLNLASLVAREHPEHKTRERQARWLKCECLGGYVMHESERMYGTKDWETLPDAELARLHDHLRARPHARKAVAAVCDRRPGADTAPLQEEGDDDPDWSVD